MFSVAIGEIESRRDEFIEKTIERIIDQKQGNQNAFVDPDVHLAWRTAAISYARSGDKDLRDILIDMIAHRSKLEGRNRLALTINRAVEIAGSLTATDFSLLTLVFNLRYTIYTEITGRDSYKKYLASHAQPFLITQNEANSSCEFLEAMQCASIQMGAWNFQHVLHSTYGGFLSKGFTLEQLMSHVPEDKRNIENFDAVVSPAQDDPNKLTINAPNRMAAVGLLKRAAKLTESEAENVAAMFESTYMSIEEAKMLFAAEVPFFGTLCDLWNGSTIQNLHLTPIGKAIAHVNATRIIPGFMADLSIWVS